MDGRVPQGLASQIDTPRLYRFEQLPRALPWETVRALLRSIDKTSAMGLRDYAMFLLIATYGLRAGELVALTLDDIRWRQGSLRIHQPKTSSSLELPLTNEVSSALPPNTTSCTSQWKSGALLVQLPHFPGSGHRGPDAPAGAPWL